MTLAPQGCRLVLASRRADRLADVAAQIGLRALAWPIDVRDDTAFDALPDCLPEAFRNIDILVNNAGHDVGGSRPFAEGETED